MGKLMIDIFRGIPGEEMVSMCKKVGFGGFFIDEESANVEEKVANFYEIAEREGMDIETIHSTIPGCWDIWNEGNGGEEYVAILKNNIDNCAKFMIPILVVHVQVKKDTEVLFNLGIKRLETVVEYAKERGVKIAFENINDANLLFKVMDCFQEEHVGFCYDCGHEACYTPDVEYLPILGGRLLCTHLHDNDGVGDMHFVPFDGKLNFESICKQLKEANYQGNITLELSYMEIYQEKMSKEEFVKYAYDAACKIKKMLIES